MTADGMKQIIFEIANRNNYEFTDSQLASIELEDIAVNVAFLGEFSSGKSSIVNCLIGRDLLPSYNEPTSAVITEIMPGENDEYFVDRTNEQNELVREQLALHELAAETMKYEENKKITVIQKEFGVLNRNLLIVDTPGVASINETHTDITFGYLPFIDVAIFVVAVTKGDATESLINFISKLPKSFLDKTYFILNKIDLKPDSAVDRIEENFRKAISKISPNPRILKVSALEAGQKIFGFSPSRIVDTSMSPLITIINEDVPKLKREVEENKRKKKLAIIGNQIIGFLKVKLEGLKYSDSEISDGISRIKADVQDNENKISEHKRKMNDIKNGVQQKVASLINDTAQAVAVKVDRGEDFQRELNTLINGLNETLETAFGKIKDASQIELNASLSVSMAGTILDETKFMTSLAENIRDLVNFILIALAIPGTSSAEKFVSLGHTATSSRPASILGKMLTASKTLVSNVNKFKKNFPVFSKIVGEMAEMVDVAGLVKTAIMKQLLQPKLRGILIDNIESKIDEIFTEIDSDLELSLDTNYRIPMKDAMVALEELRKTRDYQNLKMEALRRDLEKDIQKLRQFEA